MFSVLESVSTAHWPSRLSLAWSSPYEILLVLFASIASHAVGTHDDSGVGSSVASISIAEIECANHGTSTGVHSNILVLGLLTIHSSCES